MSGKKVVMFIQDSLPGKKTPKWKRSFGLSDDGVIFIPGAIVANETKVFLCAGFDGIPAITYSKHPYFPVTWLATEFPKSKELCQKIEANIKGLPAVKKILSNIALNQA